MISWGLRRSFASAGLQNGQYLVTSKCFYCEASSFLFISFRPFQKLQYIPARLPHPFSDDAERHTVASVSQH